jgi:hypothetical protein
MPSGGTQGTMELRQYYNTNAGDNYVTTDSDVPEGELRAEGGGRSTARNITPHTLTSLSVPPTYRLR